MGSEVYLVYILVLIRAQPEVRGIRKALQGILKF